MHYRASSVLSSGVYLLPEGLTGDLGDIINERNRSVDAVVDPEMVEPDVVVTVHGRNTRLSS